jgi:hypothetical protein
LLCGFALLTAGCDNKRSWSIVDQERFALDFCLGKCFDSDLIVDFNGDVVHRWRDLEDRWQTKIFKVSPEDAEAFRRALASIRPAEDVRVDTCHGPDVRPNIVPTVIEWRGLGGARRLESCGNERLFDQILAARRALRFSIVKHRLVDRSAAADPNFF